MTGFLHNLYQNKVNNQVLAADEGQEACVKALDDLRNQLIEQPKLNWRFWRNQTPKGLYIWGAVGRGKTYWMDLFYDSLPFAPKRRVHFHSFMQNVHQLLKKARGQKNPIESVADDIAAGVKVLCFDEFVVIDIADAMTLGALFKALTQRGVTFVITSNVPPGRLYEHGVARDRFLPAIHMLQKKLKVIELKGRIDYRTQNDCLHARYYTPLDAGEADWMKVRLESLCPDSFDYDTKITLFKRTLQVRALAKQAIWFDFNVLCGKGRGTEDYLSLSQDYEVLFLSHVPCLDESQEDAARRFVHLIDTWYDAKRLIFISAEGPIEALYTGKRVAFEFQRTASRLIEMQSDEYYVKQQEVICKP